MIFRLLSKSPLIFVVAILISGIGVNVQAEEITVAVASNFSNTMKTIAKQFEKDRGHKVYISIGSSGRHYAQIKNGAPFDVFLSADAHRPTLLEEEGIAVAKSRFTYALGKIVLWSPDKSLIDKQGQILRSPRFQHIAMANPRLAPYGRSAKEIIDAIGLWDTLSAHIVQGENIGQTFQFVKSGNAQLGFVAWSQIKQSGSSDEGSHWQVPEALYTPIEQQAVLLNDNPVAIEFIAYLQTDATRSTIRDAGYSTP